MFVASISEVNESETMDLTCHLDTCVVPLASVHSIVVLNSKYCIYFVWVSHVYGLCQFPVNLLLSLFNKQTINQLIAIGRVHK